MPVYSNTYTDLIGDLDWLLKQEREGSDTADEEKFRSLPHARAKRVISETLHALADTAPDRYERDLVLRFYDAPNYNPVEHGYHDIDIDGEFVKGNYLLLPPSIKRLVAVKMDSGLWEVLYDSSQSQREMYSPAHNEIYFEDGWVDDYELVVRSIVYPKKLKDNISAINTVGTPTPTSAGFVTITTSSAHGLEYGDYVTLAGFTPTGYNGKWYVVHVPSTTSVVLYTGLTSAITAAGTIALNTDTQTIEIDDSFYEYLKLEIKRRAFGRLGKAISTYEFSLLKQYERAWMASKGRVKKKAARYQRGYGFGK